MIGGHDVILTVIRQMVLSLSFPLSLSLSLSQTHSLTLSFLMRGYWILRVLMNLGSLGQTDCTGSSHSCLNSLLIVCVNVYLGLPYVKKLGYVEGMCEC